MFDSERNVNSSFSHHCNLFKYFSKMRGGGQSPPRVRTTEIFWSCLGGFLGIASVSFAHQHLLDRGSLIMIIGSFGASAVLLYGIPRSPFAQPRSLIGGHILSAAIGVTAWKLMGGCPWVAGALAVSAAIAVMHLTTTLHPPGGATALIAVIGGDRVHHLGYFYIVAPVVVGVGLMLIVALLINNIPRAGKYPEYWY